MAKADIHFVYVISAIVDGVPVAPCKIGITSNVVHRLSSIQTGNPTRLHVISTIPLPDRDIVRAIEAEIHDHFYEFRLEGEWFDVCPVDAAIGVCTVAHDAFKALAGDAAAAYRALEQMGITNEIRQCFEFIEHCQSHGLPLKTRFGERRDGSHTHH